MGSPPKPWERNGGAAVAAAAASAPSLPSNSTTTSNSIPPVASTSAPPAASSSSSSSSAPTVPDRPAAFSGATAPASSATTSMATPYNRLGTYGGYGGLSSTYGGYGGLGSSYGGYGGYGGLGSYGGMGYSGVGSYGGMGGYGGYGGYGMGMNGMGMGMGMGGMYGPNPPLDANGNPIPTLTQTFEATTQHTFGLLHSIVQTFGGLAQMLESTFMATHSSFFAMVGVVDQFTQLRNAMGSVLGLFGLVRWMQDTITGKRPSASTGGVMQNEFRRFIDGKPVQGPLGPPGATPPRGSRKPLIFFLIAIFGIPYAMSKLIKMLAARAEAQGQLAPPGAILPGQTLPNGQQLPPLDPASLTFARALYPFSASNSSELSLKENEIVAIMGKFDNRTGQEVDPRLEVEADWWKGRTRDGREGWFPKKWVEVLQKKGKTVD